MRATNKTLFFQKLETTQLGGRHALMAAVSDANDSVVYDYCVIHGERQLELVIQAHAGMDVTDMLGVLNAMQLD